MNEAEFAGEWVSAVSLYDVMEGEPTACQIAGQDIAIYLVDGSYFATSNICTHAYALLSDGLLEGCVVECPLHNGRFDIRTGRALTSPAEADLATFQTRVVESDLQVFIPG